MAIEALVFDAYGTLYDVHSVALRCDAQWPGQGMQLSQLWRAKQLEYTWQRSLMRQYEPFSRVTRDALAFACEALRLPAADIEPLMEEYLRLKPFPEAAQALSTLRMPKAILSNGSPDMLHPLVENSGLRLDAVLSVHELRVFKPAPEVYELAVRKLKAAKERIGFVSSNCWDAQGAKAFGFTVFWINRAAAPLDRLGFAPDHCIRSLAELDEILR